MKSADISHFLLLRQSNASWKSEMLGYAHMGDGSTVVLDPGEQINISTS